MNNLPVTVSPKPDELVQQVHREHLAIAKDFAKAFALVGGAAVIFTSSLAFAVSSNAPAWLVLSFFTAFGFAAIIALSIVRALVYARHTLTVLLYEWQQWQEHAREIARISAERLTSVNVKGRSNVVAVNSAGQAVENIRLVGLNVNRPTRIVDGVDERDLVYFVERIFVRGHSKRAWLGEQLPSGKVVSTFADYNSLISPLIKAGLIVDRGERSAGKLITDNAGVMKRVLGLPNGETQETKEVN